MHYQPTAQSALHTLPEPKGIAFIEKSITEIVKTNLNYRAYDRGRLGMVSAVLRDEALAVAIEDWDQVYASIAWPALYGAMAEAAAYYEQLVSPAPPVSRDQTYPRLVDARSRIAVIIENAFRKAILARLDAEIEAFDWAGG